ncbi:hypothetical protein [uncultured Sphingomonas sp.]|uniref:hypothetical protein n=1 Tax=uncultured Sphingomonas sp. TaxID=158754 RepID=UPI002592BDB0|nr:hypothetical protein [uncultured Sphingomonas sp.]
MRPLSSVARNEEDLLYGRGFDIAMRRCGCVGTGPMFAREIRSVREFRHWQWPLNEMHVQLNVEMVCLWRTVVNERPLSKGLRLPLNG